MPGDPPQVDLVAGEEEQHAQPEVGEELDELRASSPSTCGPMTTPSTSSATTLGTSRPAGRGHRRERARERAGGDDGKERAGIDRRDHHVTPGSRRRPRAPSSTTDDAPCRQSRRRRSPSPPAWSRAASIRPVAWYPGVSTHPGAIAFTRTRGASSSASDRVNATNRRLRRAAQQLPRGWHEGVDRGEVDHGRAVLEMPRPGRRDLRRDRLPRGRRLRASSPAPS